MSFYDIHNPYAGDGLSCGVRKWPSAPRGWLPWKGLGGGYKSHIPQAFPEKSQGEVPQQQEARPKPTSCTGFLDSQDKEKEQATWRRGSCSTEDEQVGAGRSQPQLLPSHLGVPV